jgi:hypothetical protein
MSVFFVFLLYSQVLFSQSVTISGTIKEQSTGETVPYATLVDSVGQEGLALSNAYGFFSFNVQAEKKSTILVRHVGFRNAVVSITPSNDTTLNIQLDEAIQVLDEILIAADPGLFIPGNSTLISALVIKQAPSLLGEKDALKAIQLLPGIQRGVEGSTAFYVRGGGPDQNLIIADGATIYNANHLFGFVSMFNADAIKGVSFYKGSFPARYGGRVSSVTDIQTKDGDKSATNVAGGLGLLSARLTVDGPIRKDRSSFLISARRSFLDLAIRPFMSKGNRDLYRLFDVSGKLNFNLNERDKLFVSAFIGGDKVSTTAKIVREQYSFRSETNLGWANNNLSVRWNHIFSDKVFHNISLVTSRYNFFVDDTYDRKGLNANYTHTDLGSGIESYSLKQDLDFYFSNSHTFRIGNIFSRNEFTPRIFYTKDAALENERTVWQTYLADEYACYLEDSWKISQNFTADIGLRYASMNTPDARHSRLEPRVHLHYVALKRWKLDIGYTRSNQFMHLLSNTGVGLPTDLWVPATAIAPPQQGDLISGGISRTTANDRYKISIETYRRFLRNIVSYKTDAVFLDPEETSTDLRWEDNIAIGQGESYGTELFLEKRLGQFTGWLSYTLAWAINQFDDINNGKRFFPRHDSRHNVVVYLNFKLSEKINLSANWFYATGNAFTIPQAYYYSNFATGTERYTFLSSTDVTYPLITEKIVPVPYFGSKNSYRAEAYHRLDISIQFHKKKKSYERYWEFGLFNAYNRSNPFYYYLESSNDFVNKGQRIDLRKKALFPILPSITYNFSF